MPKGESRSLWPPSACTDSSIVSLAHAAPAISNPSSKRAHLRTPPVTPATQAIPTTSSLPCNTNPCHTTTTAITTTTTTSSTPAAAATKSTTATQAKPAKPVKVVKAASVTRNIVAAKYAKSTNSVKTASAARPAPAAISASTPIGSANAIGVSTITVAPASKYAKDATDTTTGTTGKTTAVAQPPPPPPTLHPSPPDDTIGAATLSHIITSAKCDNADVVITGVHDRASAQYRLIKRRKQEELRPKILTAERSGDRAIMKNQKKKVDNHASAVASRVKQDYLIRQFDALVREKMSHNVRMADSLLAMSAVVAAREEQLRVVVQCNVELSQQIVDAGLVPKASFVEMGGAGAFGATTHTPYACSAEFMPVSLQNGAGRAGEVLAVEPGQYLRDGICSPNGTGKVDPGNEAPGHVAQNIAQAPVAFMQGDEYRNDELCGLDDGSNIVSGCRRGQVEGSGCAELPVTSGLVGESGDESGVGGAMVAIGEGLNGVDVVDTGPELETLLERVGAHAHVSGASKLEPQAWDSLQSSIISKRQISVRAQLKAEQADCNDFYMNPFARPPVA